MSALTYHEIPESGALSFERRVIPRTGSTNGKQPLMGVAETASTFAARGQHA